MRFPQRCPYHVECLMMGTISLVAVLGMVVFVAWVYPSLPDQIPTHFNFQGQADGFGAKMSIWFLVALCGGLWAMVTFLGHFPRTWNIPVTLHEANLYPVCRWTRAFLYLINLLVVVIFWGFVLKITGFGFLALAYVGLGALLVSLAVYFVFVFRM